MGIPYLKHRPWSSWTRDERFFCAVLYAHASKEPTAFARWLIDKANLKEVADSEWDLGVEVCFYRDYLWHQPGKSAGKVDLPAKRTFDLCLFGERDIIIVEAKVCEPYDLAQNEDFRSDKEERINGIPGLEGIRVHLVALASSRYFANAKKFGRPETLTMFDGRVSWADVNGRYPDDLLAQADQMYSMRPGETLTD
ncbi:MAG: hypothetical protein M5U26_10430 [Planctomycetota bacterium]|nr:hypothetical protein [Planctomycetota bacterium]